MTETGSEFETRHLKACALAERPMVSASQSKQEFSSFLKEGWGLSRGDSEGFVGHQVDTWLEVQKWRGIPGVRSTSPLCSTLLPCSVTQYLVSSFHFLVTTFYVPYEGQTRHPIFLPAGAHTSVFPQHALPHLAHQHGDAFVEAECECHRLCEAYLTSYYPCLGGAEQNFLRVQLRGNWLY